MSAKALIANVECAKLFQAPKLDMTPCPQRIEQVSEYFFEGFAAISTKRW